MESKTITSSSIHEFKIGDTITFIQPKSRLKRIIDFILRRKPMVYIVKKATDTTIDIYSNIGND